MRRSGGTGWRGVLWVLAGIVAGVVLQARGATLVVDPLGSTPYTTIQSAIDAAVPGQDDVFVRCGYYTERILMKNGVSVRGEGAPCTTIDGGRRGTVVRIPNAQDPMELSGFTVRGGSGSASSFGYGIHMEGSGAPVITRNIVEDNFNSGIAAYPMASGADLAPVITRNVIRNNQGCCAGGGIWLLGQSDAAITSNLILGNTATYGAGIYAAGKALIAHNTIVQNVSNGYGGGVWAAGGVGMSPTFSDNVIADNRALNGGGVTHYLAAALFLRNDAFRNLPNNYYPEDPTNQDGNVSVDPLFVDQRATFFGFQLRSLSPLLEALAGPPSPGEPALDLAGLPRFLDGDADGVAASDIGARENDGPTRLAPLPQGNGFGWDPVVRQPVAYEAFRGDLDVLRTTGLYTQDPATVLGARHFCDLPTPALADSDVPDPGQVLFYVAAARGAVAGTLGFTSAAVERPRTMACTPP